MSDKQRVIAALGTWWGERNFYTQIVKPPKFVFIKIIAHSPAGKCVDTFQHKRERRKVKTKISIQAENYIISIVQRTERERERASAWGGGKRKRERKNWVIAFNVCWEIHGAHDNCAQKKSLFFLHPSEWEKLDTYTRRRKCSRGSEKVFYTLSHLHVLHDDFSRSFASRCKLKSKVEHHHHHLSKKSFHYIRGYFQKRKTLKKIDTKLINIQYTPKYTPKNHHHHRHQSRVVDICWHTQHKSPTHARRIENNERAERSPKFELRVPHFLLDAVICTNTIALRLIYNHPISPPIVYTALYIRMTKLRALEVSFSVIFLWKFFQFYSSLSHRKLWFHFVLEFLTELFLFWEREKL